MHSVVLLLVAMTREILAFRIFTFEHNFRGPDRSRHLVTVKNLGRNVVDVTCQFVSDYALIGLNVPFCHNSGEFKY